MTGMRIDVFLDLTSRIAHEARQIIYRSIEKVGDPVEVRYRFVVSDHASEIAARAAYAAEQLDLTEAMIDALANYEGQYNEASMLGLLDELSGDRGVSGQILQAQEFLSRLEEDRHLASAANLAVMPGLTIDDMPYNGAWDEDALFEAMLERSGRRVEHMIDGFFRWGAAAAFALLLATAVALLVANLGGYQWYEALRHLEFGLTLDSHGFRLSAEAWINDGLMSLFFLLIGIEIKREILFGELSDVKRAALPVIGAFGGMVIPAAIYALVNWNTPTSNAWGVPMATDIAFTLGLLTLLASRVPFSLKVFVSALAVADDLGAIVVIAIFYGHGFDGSAFVVATLIVAIMGILNRGRVYATSVYLFLGAGLWFFIHEAGLHATLAGVITAIMLPSRPSGNLVGAAEQARVLFDQEIAHARGNPGSQGMRAEALHNLQGSIDRLREPSYHLEYALERWVNFLILPLFAFYNTGISFADGLSLDTTHSIGIVLGLCVGKPLGIVGACWIATKLKIAQISEDIQWRHLIGAGALAGVGFTMSIVVASSAFAEEYITGAKLSILIASVVSASLGMIVLAWPSKIRQPNRD